MQLPTEFSTGLHAAGDFLKGLWDKVPPEFQADVTRFAEDLHAKADAEIPEAVTQVAGPQFEPEIAALITNVLDHEAAAAAAKFETAKAQVAAITRQPAS
jgi:hypothetical protein